MFGLKTIPPALQQAGRDLLFFVSILINRVCICMLLLLHLNVPPFMVLSGAQQRGSTRVPKPTGNGKGKGKEPAGKKNSNADDDNDGGGNGGNNGGGGADSDGGGGGGGGGSGGGSGGGGGGGSGGGDGDDNGDDNGDDYDNDGGDGSDKEDDDKAKKTFDFYFNSNRKRSSDARSEIKTILESLTQIESEEGDQKDAIKILNARLSEQCRIYRLQTKYYQAGNFNTMPLIWWVKANKGQSWMHKGVYNYSPDKHFQFIEQVVAFQMLLEANDAFFTSYEAECAKWYASWAINSANKAPDTVNTWTRDSYTLLPDTNNAEDTTMVLERLNSDVFPKLDDNDQSKPHTKPSKKKGGGAGPAGLKNTRRQKDAPDNADTPAGTNKRKRASGGARRKFAKAAREKADADAVAAVDPDDFDAPDAVAAGGDQDAPAQPSAESAQQRAELQAGPALDVASGSAVSPALGGVGAAPPLVPAVAIEVVDLTADSEEEGPSGRAAEPDDSAAEPDNSAATRVKEEPENQH